MICTITSPNELKVASHVKPLPPKQMSSAFSGKEDDLERESHAAWE